MRLAFVQADLATVATRWGGGSPAWRHRSRKPPRLSARDLRSETPPRATASTRQFRGGPGPTCRFSPAPSARGREDVRRPSREGGGIDVKRDGPCWTTAFQCSS